MGVAQRDAPKPTSRSTRPPPLTAPGTCGCFFPQRPWMRRSFEQILQRAGTTQPTSAAPAERIYQDVIPSSPWPSGGRAEPASGPRRDHQMAMLVLFRLLFISTRKTKTLPYRTNEAYRRRSRAARELLQVLRPARPGPASYWDEVRTLWRAVDEGPSGASHSTTATCSRAIPRSPGGLRSG